MMPYITQNLSLVVVHSFQDVNGRRVQHHAAVVSSVCIRPYSSVSSMALSVNVIQYLPLHKTYRWLHRFLGTSKSTEECCEAEVSLCFAQRIKDNKSKKMKTKANSFSKCECRDCVDWSRSWTRSHFGTNAFQMSSERVRNTLMLFTCLWAALYVSSVHADHLLFTRENENLAQGGQPTLQLLM